MNEQIKGNIYIVEDSPTQAKEISLLLNDAGHETKIFSKGEEAISFIEKEAPDLIILDIILPDIDGYTVCRRIRKLINSYIPVLMLSQRSEVEDKVDGLEIGADDYLAKPFDPRELVARVHALLRLKRLQDELERKLEEEKRDYEKLRDMAITDPLTGLYNRYYLFDILGREFTKCQRYDTPLGCIIIDVDHFRRFNNTYGHPTGDWILKELANMLKNNIRKVDIVSRYGGEEFVIIQPLSNLTSTARTATRLRQIVDERQWKSSKGLHKITISAGVSAYPEAPAKNYSELIDLADKALLEAKRKGRNRVEIFKAINI